MSDIIKNVNVETLKEVLRVKYKDGDESYFKKHHVNDVVVIKDATANHEDMESLSDEELKELEKLEKLGKADEKENNDKI